MIQITRYSVKLSYHIVDPYKVLMNNLNTQIPKHGLLHKPPLTDDDGSTASTATCWPDLVSILPNASMNVDLPAPGGPVKPVLIIVQYIFKILYKATVFIYNNNVQGGGTIVIIHKVTCIRLYVPELSNTQYPMINDSLILTRIYLCILKRERFMMYDGTHYFAVKYKWYYKNHLHKHHPT